MTQGFSISDKWNFDYFFDYAANLSARNIVHFHIMSITSQHEIKNYISKEREPAAPVLVTTCALY